MGFCDKLTSERVLAFVGPKVYNIIGRPVDKLIRVPIINLTHIRL